MLDASSSGTMSTDRIRERSSHSNSVSYGSPINHILDSPERNEIDESQIQAKIIENGSGAPEDRYDANISNRIGSVSTIHIPYGGHRGGTPRTPLTSRALRKDNIQQTQISEQKHTIKLEAIEASDGELHNPYDGSTGDRNGYLVHARFHAQRKKPSTETFSSEADGSATDHEATSDSGSCLVDEISGMDRLRAAMHVFHHSSWDKGPAYEPTAWGNDLSGIGEHLVDYTHQEYASHGELVVD